MVYLSSGNSEENHYIRKKDCSKYPLMAFVWPGLILASNILKAMGSF